MPINKPAILRAVCKNFVFGAYNLDFVGYSEPRLVNEVSLQKDSKIPTSTNQNSDNFQNCHLNWVDQRQFVKIHHTFFNCLLYIYWQVTSRAKAGNAECIAVRLCPQVHNFHLWIHLRRIPKCQSNASRTDSRQIRKGIISNAVFVNSYLDTTLRTDFSCLLRERKLGKLTAKFNYQPFRQQISQ